MLQATRGHMVHSPALKRGFAQTIICIFHLVFFFFLSVYLRIVCFPLCPLDGSIATKIKKNKNKNIIPLSNKMKNYIQPILPHKKRLKLQDHLVYLWPLESYCIFQSCSGPHEAVTQQVKEESVRNRNAN